MPSVLTKSLSSVRQIARVWIVVGVAVCVSGWALARDAGGDSAIDQRSRLLASGARLFADARLSRDGNVSCATCHAPSRAFTDGRPTSIGTGELAGTRNAPSLLNVAEHSSFFWDGRRESLGALILDPLTHPLEHGFANEAQVLSAVRRLPDLVELLTAAFGIKADQLEINHIVTPLMAYVRSLRSRPSAFDRHLSGKGQLGPAALRGYRLFTGAAQCSACHLIEGSQPDFTDQRFHAVLQAPSAMRRLPALVKRLVEAREHGQPVDHTLLTDKDISALGRFAVTLEPADIGTFKTPSLRNVAITAPYMHDGSVATLEQAIELEIYDRGARAGTPLVLSPEEKADLAAFLEALTDEDYTAR